MARILGIDYGAKRTGLAVTDPLQIIVTGLETVETVKLNEFISDYFKEEEVEKVVIGIPTHRDGSYTILKTDIEKFASFISKTYPEKIIDYQDEAFTSAAAKEIIFQSGIKKSKRRDKKLVDKVSAVLILQKYLKHI